MVNQYTKYESTYHCYLAKSSFHAKIHKQTLTCNCQHDCIDSCLWKGITKTLQSLIHGLLSACQNCFTSAVTFQALKGWKCSSNIFQPSFKIRESNKTHQPQPFSHNVPWLAPPQQKIFIYYHNRVGIEPKTAFTGFLKQNYFQVKMAEGAFDASDVQFYHKSWPSK